jgi:hypothetical protein
MGLTFSAPLSEESMSNKFKGQNIQKLADAKVEDNILDTLNLSELTPPAAKLQMPLIGGYDYTSEGDFAYNFPKGKTQKKERYNNYDLFNVMAELEAKKNIVGGNLEQEELQNDEKHQSTSTDPGMSALKSILVDEMNKYKNKNSENGSITGGGDCGCTGNTKVLEGGKKKKGKKSKKSKKVMKGGISSSSDDSSSVENNFKLKREDVATSNEELEENGLSIFKYNSSDVSNQTSSERNFRMLRRKM